MIEAVFEDVDVKTALWARPRRRRAGATRVFASNTSSIAIDRLAGRRRSPGRRPRFVGMHFFSPVPVMPLSS